MNTFDSINFKHRLYICNNEASGNAIILMLKKVSKNTVLKKHN